MSLAEIKCVLFLCPDDTYTNLLYSDIIGRDGQSETVGKASHPVKIYINDVAHAMTHHRSDAHASACQKVLRSDSRHALVG